MQPLASTIRPGRRPGREFGYEWGRLCGFNSYGFASSTARLPFLWQDGVMTKLATLGGENGYANMINNRGEVAGLAETAMEDSTSGCPVHSFEPVVWENGVIGELLTYPGDSDGVAAWINDKGEVAGASGTCAPFNPNSGLYLTENHALVWQNGKATDLGNLGPNGTPGRGTTPVQSITVVRQWAIQPLCKHCRLPLERGERHEGFGQTSRGLRELRDWH